MKGKKTKIGDIFSVKIDEFNQKFFQYITNDLTQLNSDVIRVFKCIYPLNVKINLSEVIAGDVDFYAHCVIKLGIELEYWRWIGNVGNVGDFSHVWFRDTDDFGNPDVKISRKWWVWKINQDEKYVGELKGIYQQAEIGVVMNPEGIVNRIITGKYGNVYPEF